MVNQIVLNVCNMSDISNISNIFLVKMRIWFNLHPSEEGKNKPTILTDGYRLISTNEKTSILSLSIAKWASEG